MRYILNLINSLKNMPLEDYEELKENILQEAAGKSANVQKLIALIFEFAERDRT